MYQLIFDKGVNTQWDRIVSSINGSGKMINTCRRVKLHPCLIAFTKTDSK